MTASFRSLLLLILPLLFLGTACSKNDQAPSAEKPVMAVETAVATPATLLVTIPVTGTLTADCLGDTTPVTVQCSWSQTPVLSQEDLLAGCTCSGSGC